MEPICTVIFSSVAMVIIYLSGGNLRVVGAAIALGFMMMIVDLTILAANTNSHL